MKVTVITMEGCSHCAQVFKHLEALSADFPDTKIETIDITSDEGQKLVAEHSILSSPGVLIDGEFVFFGPRSKEEIRDMLSSHIST